MDLEDGDCLAGGIFGEKRLGDFKFSILAKFNTFKLERFLKGDHPLK